jgi:hypothetical protein
LLAERQSTVEERYRAENPLQVEVLLLLGDVAVGDQGPACTSMRFSAKPMAAWSAVT